MCQNRWHTQIVMCVAVLRLLPYPVHSSSTIAVDKEILRWKLNTKEINTAYRIDGIQCNGVDIYSVRTVVVRRI